MEMTLQPEKPRIATGKILLWISMASMVMLFAGLTSGYIVRKAEGRWTEFTLPLPFTVSTVIMLISSVTMHLALRAVKRNDIPALKQWLVVTLALGLGFVFSQFLGWNMLTHKGIYFVDKANPSGSFFYSISGLHLAHLIGGIIALLITNGKALLGRYSANKYLGVELCSIYWHFLDGLWIYLFVFLTVY